jgi:polar amino acid transport system substrate-binding protein
VSKWSIIMLATATVLGAASCGGSSESSNRSSTSTAPENTSTSVDPNHATPIPCDSGQNAYVQETGQPSDFKPVTADTLTVATSLPGPGFWEGSDTDPTKVHAGYEYDIANKLEDAFGLHQLVVRNVSFDEIEGGHLKDFDVILSQIPITCSRAKVSKFSIPYFLSHQAALVKKGFGKPLRTIDDARKIKWGVEKSTTSSDVLDKISPDTKPHTYSQLDDGYAALRAGQIDAFLADSAINLGEAARSKGEFSVPAQFSLAGGTDQYGIMLPSDSTNTPSVNAVIEELQNSGQLSALARKDLTADPGTLPLINVP